MGGISSRSVCQKKIARLFIKGHFRAIEYLKSRPQDAEKRMAPRLNNDALAQFNGLHLPDVNENRVFFAGASPNLRSAARDLADLMLRRKLLQRPVATDRFADPNYLPGGVQ
jgi:hypothetical protein